MRHISARVWTAGALAIIPFAINATPLFRSVEQYSVFMITALPSNTYNIALLTSALTVVHHMYFLNKGRNLQKRCDVLNDVLLGCRRSEHLVRVLEVVQNNVADGGRAYRMDKDLIHQRMS